MAHDIFPDAEAGVAASIRNAAISGLGTRVYSSIPREPTYPLCIVKRIGGTPAEKHRLDRPNIQIEVWGNSKSEAHDIAQQARRVVHELEGTTMSSPVPIYFAGVVDSLGMTWAPDPMTDRDRYLFASMITTHTTDDIIEPSGITGLIGWWQGSTLAGLAEGENIAVWPDSSGNGAHLLQATVAAQPTYRATAIAGRPAARFDGTDDQLLSVLSPWPALTAGTCFIVFTRQAASTLRGVVAFTGATNTRWQINSETSGSDDIQALIGTGVGNYSDNSGAGMGTGPLIGSFLVDSAADTSSLWINGTLRDSNSGLPDINTGASNITVGSRAGINFYLGDVAEVIVFDRSLVSANRQAVERYLGRKYNITVP